MLLILIYLESTNHRAAAFAMKVFCIGSINIDHYYRCRKIVGPGESLPAQEYSRAIGGKGTLSPRSSLTLLGLNQAFALFKVCPCPCPCRGTGWLLSLGGDQRRSISWNGGR